MSAVVTFEKRGNIGLIWIDSPPVNALGWEVRSGLCDCLKAGEADGEVQAIVLLARGRTFPVGADIREFGKSPREPLLPETCNRLEACSKPVIAALHGTALGGGFELALAAHYRIAQKDAKVGLPEITLGLVPGAGGTQRLPRLTGIPVALEFMSIGRPVMAQKALSLGMLDKISEGDLEADAIAYAGELIAAGAGTRPTQAITERLKTSPADHHLIDEFRDKAGKSPVLAALKVVECVEAAPLLPFTSGLAFERDAFETCLKSEASLGLRHSFMAERKAAKFFGLEGVSPRPVTTVGIVGGGTMGTGIAIAFLNGGYSVHLVEQSSDQALVARDRIEKTYAAAVAKRRLSDEGVSDRLARLSLSSDLRDLSECELIIEAIIEDMDAKQELFRALEEILKPGAILATNTSYLDVDLLADTTDRAGDTIGLHFFSPADRMRLLEVVVGAQTSATAVATAVAVAKSLGKIPVRSGVTDGFIANRMLTAYRTAADFALEDGASISEIDAAMRGFGFSIGPYQVLDLAGLDISWARRKRLADSRDPELRYVDIGDKLCEAGRFGKKVGQGYYDYSSEHPRGAWSEMVSILIERVRQEKGISAQEVTAKEIQDRVLLAMIAEGLTLLEDGIAERPSDIDTVMHHGFGFPRWRGGPMHAADHMGLLAVRNSLDALQAEGTGLWIYPPLLNELIKHGQSLGSLN